MPVLAKAQCAPQPPEEQVHPTIKKETLQNAPEEISWLIAAGLGQVCFDFPHTDIFIFHMTACSLK